MTLKFHSNLLKDLDFMLNSADDYDAVIHVIEGSNVKEFPAHSNILRVRSPYFKKVLLTDITKKEKNLIIFNKPYITPIVFDIVLR